MLVFVHEVGDVALVCVDTVGIGDNNERLTHCEKFVYCACSGVSHDDIRVLVVGCNAFCVVEAFVQISFGPPRPDL